MTAPRVRVFFYGSYMNKAVLADAGVVRIPLTPARLDGYDIYIAPRANLVPSTERCVYGLVADATHLQLARLYQHAHDVLGETYLPHPVLVQLVGGGWVPALCYLSPDMTPRPPDPEYISRIVAPAREHHFPAWYVKRLEQERRAG